MLARFVVAASMSCVTGCLPIPHKELDRPRAEFEVRDARGAVVAGATVHLYGGYIVAKSTRWALALDTDSLGRADVERAKQWHLIVVLAADGEQPMVWAWCAEARGHVATGALDREPDAPVRVALPDSTGGRCPAKPKTLRDVTQSW